MGSAAGFYAEAACAGVMSMCCSFESVFSTDRLTTWIGERGTGWELLGVIDLGSVPGLGFPVLDVEELATDF